MVSQYIKAIIPSEAIKATMALSEQYDFNYYFESSDYIYVRDQNDERHQWFAKNWGMKPETVIDDFDPETLETYIGMIVVNDKKDISPMVNALSKYFDVQRHQSDYSFDLTLKGVSKAVGIEKLVEQLIEILMTLLLLVMDEMILRCWKQLRLV